MQISHLVAAFSVYAIDLRGHGHSWQAKPSPNPAEPVPPSDVVQVLSALGLERPFVFGHSLGGLLATAIETQRPGTWAGMFLFEPVLPPLPSAVRPLSMHCPCAESPGHPAISSEAARPCSCAELLIWGFCFWSFEAARPYSCAELLAVGTPCRLPCPR